jgi:hypothetical protein
MVPELRSAFHARFTLEKYQVFLERLAERCGGPVAFRNCETPCFFPAGMLERIAQAGMELIQQLTENPAYLAAAAEQIPPAYRVPNTTPKPLFVQADFGLTADWQPKLVEIQGFPSLYAYQSALAETYREVYDLDASLKTYLSDLTEETYANALREAILGECAPENVVLLDIEPEKQKTAADFRLTERLCGLSTVCLTQVEKQGRTLYYRRAGRRIPIERIYNRVIVDELVRKHIQPPFDWRDDLAVAWAGHPNWYFQISKFSLPYLNHATVPRTCFLHEIETLPDDLENYVLKPLYSFAGLGVVIGPSRADIEAIADRTQYILQERMEFAPVIETPHGPTKVEIRIMYLWHETLRPMTALLRMGRGKMMGVDHNRAMEWVGASAAFSLP